MSVPAKDSAAAVEALAATTVGEYLRTRHNEKEAHPVGMQPHKQARLSTARARAALRARCRCCELARARFRVADASLSPRLQVAMISTTQSVGDAMQVLAAEHVLSAPLVLLTSSSDDSKYMVLGFLSVGDFLRAFVERAERAVQYDTPLLTRMRTLSALGSEFCASGVIALHASDDGEVVFRGATEAMSLLELVRSGFLRLPFRRPPLPARHRVGVFDEHGHLSDIVSMSSITVWALQHFDQLGALPKRTLAELGLAGSGSEAADAPPREEVVCVPTEMPTHVAFGTALHRGVSAVGVTDAASGVLVANLSQSDFRSFAAYDFGSLALPVGEFLVHRHNQSVPADDEAAGEHGDNAPGSSARGIRDPWARALAAARVAVTLRPDDTFLRLLEALVAARVHRVYICNDQMTPVAVVSHTDVLAVLLRGHKPAP